MSPELRQHLRAPILTLFALLGLLSINVLLGVFFISGHVWIAEAFVVVTMVAIVILYAMEVLKDVPITRLFAAIGFVWVLILFGLTMVDYVTR